VISIVEQGDLPVDVSILRKGQSLLVSWDSSLESGPASTENDGHQLIASKPIHDYPVFQKKKKGVKGKKKPSRICPKTLKKL
jgi:hypothetical protein